MRRLIARGILVMTVAGALGVAAPPPAGAVGCDQQLGPIAYGRDTKPPDICVSVAGVQAGATLTPNPTGAIGGQYVCVLSTCQGSVAWVDTDGPVHAGAATIVCATPTACVTADASAEGTRPHAHVCYFLGTQSQCTGLNQPVRTEQ